MNFTDIAHHRLNAQRIIPNTPQLQSAKEVVAHMGAMQAQDFNGALWAIGLRTANLTVTDVELAIENREIVRTWPMRGTLHFVAAEDIRWMLDLLAPRKLASIAGQRRQLELTDDILVKATEVVAKALSGGKRLTKDKLFEALEANSIATDRQRGIHIHYYLTLIGLICLGPHEGKQPTSVLLDEWLPKTAPISRDEALTKLTARYFTSHGPATLKDFARWAYITLSDAKRGIALAKGLTSEIVDGIPYWFDATLQPASTPSAALLPGFDEFMLGYKDRSAALPPRYANQIVPGNNGMFLPTIVIDGQVVGTWKKTVRKSGVAIELLPFSPIDPARLQPAVARYAAFSQTHAEIKN